MTCVFTVYSSSVALIAKYQFTRTDRFYRDLMSPETLTVLMSFNKLDNFINQIWSFSEYFQYLNINASVGAALLNADRLTDMSRGREGGRERELE